MHFLLDKEGIRYVLSNAMFDNQLPLVIEFAICLNFEHFELTVAGLVNTQLLVIFAVLESLLQAARNARVAWTVFVQEFPITTLLDPEEFTKEDSAALYRERWNAELDLRSVKQTLQMDILRCKTPELVRKEIWTHILACHLIRTVMAQAATRHDIQPRTISFQGAFQYLGEFQRLIDYHASRGCAHRMMLSGQLLDSINSQQVGDRPD